MRSFILAGLKFAWLGESVEVVKAQDLLWALTVCRDKGCQCVVVEGDCRNIIDA